MNRDSMQSKTPSNPAHRSKGDLVQPYLAEIVKSSNDPIIGGTPDGTIESWNPAAENLFGYKAAEVVGRHISVIMPAGRAGEIRRITKQARRGERIEHFEPVCVAKDGKQIDVSLTVAPIKDAAGNVVHLLFIARDLTRRKMGRAAIERRNRELLTLHKLSGIVLSSRSLEESYRDIVNEICAATGFPTAVIALYDETRQVIVFEGLRDGSLQSKRPPLEVPIDETLSGIVIRTGKPLIETHVLDHPRYRSKVMRWAKAQTFVGYPMKVGKKIIGCLNLAHTESIEITPDMARWIESLSNYAAVLTERKRSEEELRRSREQLRELSKHVQSVIEEERKRIAREIHDVLGQELSVLQLELGLIMDQLPRPEKELRKKAKSMSRLIDASIRSVQRISADLRPTLLDNLGLGAAVEWAVKEFQRRTRIRCLLSVDPPDVKLDQELSTALFRILQEALTNVLRHAKGTKVDVLLVRRDDAVVLTVRDNGKGIPAGRITDSKSVGLTGMRERVLPWRGTVKITSKPAKGTEVMVTVPIRA
jgi:PAS domain S-box-containing protein